MRRSLARKAALAATTEAAEAWANGNGHDVDDNEPVRTPTEPPLLANDGIDTLELTRLQLAGRVLALAERALDLLHRA